jgi:UDP-glucose 4-epimerase
MIESTDLTGRIAGKTVLVTGGSGFIGAHVYRKLLILGAKVHVVSRRLHRSGNEDLRWWQADLNDISTVRRLFQDVRPEIVFHLASYVVGARELRAVLPTFYDNLASTIHVLTAATEAGCERVVLAGSSDEPQNCKDSEFPCSPYAAAKWASSMYGRMFFQLFKTPVVMPRIFMTYGPDQKDGQKLVPSVVRQLLCGEAPKLGSGRRIADWIYIDDVVEGLLRAAVVPGIEGCVFDLGSGSLTSVRGIVEIIVEIVGNGVEPGFDLLPDRPFEQERVADIRFLSEKLGYKPGTSLKEGLRATVKWYREQIDAAHATA